MKESVFGGSNAAAACEGDRCSEKAGVVAAEPGEDGLVDSGCIQAGQGPCGGRGDAGVGVGKGLEEAADALCG